MIALQPMTQADFERFLAYSIAEYAKDKVRAGNWSEAEAPERSRAEFAQFLPDGLKTERAFLHMLVNETAEKVGHLWHGSFPKHPERAFIFDFEIYEPFRRRGYARQALAALDELAREQGFRFIDLHVFGHNSAARALYQQTGYVETNVNMTKEL